MWWKFKRHRVAVVSGIILLLMYGSTLVTEFLAPYNLHTRHTDFIYAPPQQRAPVPRGPLRRAVRLRQRKTLDMETLRREYTEDRVAAAPAALLLLRRPLPVLGTGRHVVPPRLPRQGRDAVPARHRPPRPRRAVAHPLRRAHLADDRPARHRDQLRARPRHRRHRRLLRRLGRHDRAAAHRDHPLVPRAAAVDGAVRRAAGHVEPDPDLLRHHRHPRAARLDGARARGALEAPRAARRGLHDGRAADGRASRAASSAATCCRAS